MKYDKPTVILFIYLFIFSVIDNSYYPFAYVVCWSPILEVAMCLCICGS